MMSKFLEGHNIVITGISELLPQVKECGNEPLDNARQKALAYYEILQRPLFSCDSGLFLDGVPSSLQPGVNVRNVRGKQLSDGEMIQYYSELAKKYGKNGMLFARYKNAICLVLNDDIKLEYDGDDISGEGFYISSVPHKERREGFPIDSISVHIEKLQYYFDLPQHNRGFSMEKGFQSFFIRHMTLIEEHAKGE